MQTPANQKNDELRKRLYIVYLSWMINILLRENHPEDSITPIKRQMEKALKTRELEEQLKELGSVFDECYGIFKKTFYNLNRYQPPEFAREVAMNDNNLERGGLVLQIERAKELDLFTRLN